MRVSKLWFTIVLLVSASASLQAQPASAGNRLADTEWRLESFGAGRLQSLVVRGTRVLLRFGADGRAGGSSGCNTYGAEYQASGNRVSFSRIISTKKACVDQRTNQQEQRYLSALAAASTFRLSGSRLTINHGRAGTLNFNAVPGRPMPLPPPPLQGQPQYEDLKSPVALVASLYNAINTREYDRAYGYWEIPPGSFDDFARGYRETVRVQLIVQPPTNIEGAAGSSYAEVPTVIVAHLRNGGERIFAGCYVTRQTNQGNSGEETWRISRATLSPVATAALIPQRLSLACRD